MGIFKKKKKKNNNITTYEIKSKVLYNTNANFIILINYGSGWNNEVIDFINGIHNINNGFNIKCVLSDSAESITNNTGKFMKETIKFINRTYYMILSGSTKSYAKIYDYVDMSNRILEEITKDIYNYCDYTPFTKLIDLVILNKSKFRYKNEFPQYDNFIIYKDYIFDNVSYILKWIPKTYNMIDLCKIFNIYTKNDSYSANTIISKAQEDLENGIYDSTYINILNDNCLPGGFFMHLMSNPSIETLSLLVTPIYLRPDDDEENVFTGDLPIDQLDELFQQSYERFTNPIDQSIYYQDIDEVLNNERIESDR